MRNRILAVLLALLLPVLAPSPAARADNSVDLLLVLAVDVSRSVDERKFRLQREGYAAALTHPQVVAAIKATATGSIAICYMEWSGDGAHVVLVDWTLVASLADAEAVAGRIRAAPRPFMDRTAIGSAIDFSVTLFPKSPFTAGRRVIDVSGDGTSNHGRSVNDARDAAVAKGIVINGLAILSEVPLSFNPAHTHPPGGLLKYYEDNVIGGTGAFALAAEGHEAFPSLILRKLIKEIALVPAFRSSYSVAVHP